MKDGDTFDTKKVEAEIESVSSFMKKLQKLTMGAAEYFSIICSFSQENTKSALDGFKNKLTYWNQDKTSMSVSLISGIDFCHKFRLNYETINKIRSADREENRAYVYDGIFDAYLDDVLNNNLTISEQNKDIIKRLSDMITSL